MMALYVQQLNLEAKMLHEQQRKKQKGPYHPPETAEAVPLSEPNEPATTSATEDAPMNSPTPNPQNILPLLSQNISNPDPQNIQAVGWTPAPLNMNIESPSQISPLLYHPQLCCHQLPRELNKIKKVKTSFRT
jgi:hypothetical protein